LQRLQFNDSYGHEAGDLVLQAVACRLLSLVRDADTVARFGGDEFIVLLEDVQNLESIETFAGKVLKALAKPLSVGEVTLTLTSSIGISLYPRDGEDGETLVRKADDAMFRAKERGRGLFLLFDPELETLSTK
jgi:diguanylate cyclase (GGDEF)-like protein